MRRLSFFVKGNVDVHDSLHSCRIGGELVWNGIGDILRAAHPGCTARLKHETWTRSDALLQSTGAVPELLLARDLEMGAYPLATQFGRALFESKADVIVLTLQPDICSSLMRHKREKFLLYTAESRTWRAEDQAWLRTEFERVPSLTVAESMANFAAIVETIRAHSEAPILIYNVSSLTPGEEIHCYQGFGETLSTRIRHFNLGLIELSERTGVSIIDVDTLVARKGGDALKLDALHLNPEGYRLIAEEVVRVLADLGLLDPGAVSL